MKNYDWIFFDLDGTITDSAEGILNSFAFALSGFGIEPDRRSLLKYVGPPLWESFTDVGLSPDQVETALRQFQIYYCDTGIYENRLFDGVTELLDRLISAGKKLVLASSKKEIHVRSVLSHFGVLDRFTFTAGSDTEAGRLDKKDVIRHCLASLNISPDEAVMVGDRKHDISGARECGLASIGVLYGYGSREELEEAGADAIAVTPGDVARILGV